MNAQHDGAGSETRELLSARTIRELSARLGIRPTKQWGQNFVIDPNTIRRIVTRAGITQADHVLEVGPGLGSLTLGLVDTEARVSAVEIDPVLASHLPETVAQYRPESVDAVRVLQVDALKVTAAELAWDDATAPTAVVANLPYNVAVPVILRMIQLLPSLKRGLVMVQEEVADRLAAGPGSKIYGVPSVKLAWDQKVTKVGVVGKNVFWPAPQISSGLVSFTRREPAAAEELRPQAFALIDAAFAQRRKSLRAALSGIAGSGAAAEELLLAAGVDPKGRGETLVVDDFARLARVMTTTSVASTTVSVPPTRVQ